MKTDDEVTEEDFGCKAVKTNEESFDRQCM